MYQSRTSQRVEYQPGGGLVGCWIDESTGKENAQVICLQEKMGERLVLGITTPCFRDYLTRAREAHPKLFSSSVQIKDYSLRRSLRRGATTESENNKVDPSTIELINRWRRKEAARGSEAGLPMRQVYTQVSRALLAMLRFSQSH